MDLFAFEFLGLDAKETVEESDVEQALMHHLTDFLLEMGKGFCFEARRKRIIIYDEYFFIDFILYKGFSIVVKEHWMKRPSLQEDGGYPIRH